MSRYVIRGLIAVSLFVGAATAIRAVGPIIFNLPLDETSGNTAFGT